MTGYNYKTIAAPRRLKKVKGVKGQDALLAHSVEELIAVEAAQGWEYLRADTFPVEAKGGMFSKPVVTERAVLVFRKPIAVQMAQPVAAQPVQPAPQPAHAPAPAPQPVVQPAPAPQQQNEPGFSIAGVEPPRTPTVGGAND